MVSGAGRSPVVTAVIEIFNLGKKSGKKSASGSVRQQHADLPQSELLLVRHDQKLHPAAQPIAIPHHASHLHRVRRSRNRKLQRYHFARLHRPAQRRPQPILRQFIGSPPQGDRNPVAKYRRLNPRVKTIPGKAPRRPLRLAYSSGLIAQSISPVPLLSKADLRLCFTATRFLNGIKGHVPPTRPFETALNASDLPANAPFFRSQVFFSLAKRV
jgi:hypothetical protein